jgi:hypothetical protein
VTCVVLTNGRPEGKDRIKPVDTSGDKESEKVCSSKKGYPLGMAWGVLTPCEFKATVLDSC